MNPFRRWHGVHLRVACQIVHIEHDADTTLVDLVTLEPSVWKGKRVATGTPFTLGFAAAESAARRELDGTMHRWEQACAVLDLGVEGEADGLRYEFATGHHQLVVTVEDPPGPRF
jgi:hypothetical protein